jgi:hypothetical protein
MIDVYSVKEERMRVQREHSRYGRGWRERGKRKVRAGHDAERPELHSTRLPQNFHAEMVTVWAVVADVSCDILARSSHQSPRGDVQKRDGP